MPALDHTCEVILDNLFVHLLPQVNIDFAEGLRNVLISLVMEGSNLSLVVLLVLEKSDDSLDIVGHSFHEMLFVEPLLSYTEQLLGFRAELLHFLLFILLKLAWVHGLGGGNLKLLLHRS